jgi:hypothetical protein
MDHSSVSIRTSGIRTYSDRRTLKPIKPLSSENIDFVKVTNSILQISLKVLIVKPLPMLYNTICII